MMAFVLRKCVINSRSINNSNKICLLVQSKLSNIPHRKSSIIYTVENKKVNCRYFSTTNILNEIVPFKLSDIGEGIREVVIKEWYSASSSFQLIDTHCKTPQLKNGVEIAVYYYGTQSTPTLILWKDDKKRRFVKIGDKVQQFDNICEVQSDKAAVTITSRYDGIVTKIYHEVDQTALVGQPLVDIDVENTADEETSSDSDTDTKKKSPKVESGTDTKAKVLTTPAVRRIAAQFKVDLSTIKPTGRNNRILKEDVLSHLDITADKSNEIPAIPSINSIPIPVSTERVQIETILEDRVTPITGFTKAMVKSMTAAMKIPHFGLGDEYDVTKLIESRESLKTIAQDKGVKLTYMPFIIKASSLALASYPVLNSSLDSSCENLIYKANHNIGVAMNTPDGLVVPVINNVKHKSILEIARELNVLQEKGLKGQLGLGDLSGGTFTLSNIGIVGATYTNPIIVPPQVCIGAFGKIQVLPRFNSQGEVVKAHILTVSWSADHRVIDGVTLAQFSNNLKHYLEDPYKLLLDI